MPTKSKAKQFRDRDIIAMRRQRVAQLRLRGLTHEEIWYQLATEELPALTSDGKPRPNPQYIENPDTGEPFDRATITRDLQALKKEWQTSAQADIQEHTAELLAEMREVAKQAWITKDYELVLRSADRRMKLLGIGNPAMSVHIEDWRTTVIALIRDGKVTPEQARYELGDGLAQELFDSIGLSVTTTGESGEASETGG